MARFRVARVLNLFFRLGMGFLHRPPIAEIDVMVAAAGLDVRLRFHEANDTPPAGDSPMVSRLEEAISRAYPESAPADVVTRRDELLERARVTGVGTPPQLTMVCAFV